MREDIAIGSDLINQKQYDAAVEHFTKLTDKDVTDHAAWNACGIAYSKKGNQEKAKYCFWRALDLKRDSQTYRRNYEKLKGKSTPLTLNKTSSNGWISFLGVIGGSILVAILIAGWVASIGDSVIESSPIIDSNNNPSSWTKEQKEKMLQDYMDAHNPTPTPTKIVTPTPRPPDYTHSSGKFSIGTIPDGWKLSTDKNNGTWFTLTEGVYFGISSEGLMGVNLKDYVNEIYFQIMSASGWAMLEGKSINHGKDEIKVNGYPGYLIWYKSASIFTWDGYVDVNGEIFKIDFKTKRGPFEGAEIDAKTMLNSVRFY